MTELNLENYKQGFLVDDDLMAGVTPHPDLPNTYVAFVLQHTTGEYLGYQPFTDIDAALQVINQIKRPWTYERLGGCGGCGKGGSCSAGACGKGSCGEGKSCPTPETATN
jgi:hypothetical protein